VIYDFMSNLGCLAARTARICKGRLIWLAADGLYCWNGTGEPFSISEKIDEDNNDGSKGIFNSTITALWGAAAEYVVADTSYWFSVPYGASVQNQRTFVLDLRLADLTDKASFYAGANPWTYYDFGFTDAISTTDRTLRTASSWKVGAANPYDYMLECIGTQDEGVDIAWKYLTRATDFGAPRHDKMFNECAVNVYTKQQTIVFKSIFDNGDFIDQMDFEVEGDEWDVAFWDEGVWSGSVGNFLIRNYRQAAVGMTVAFQITGVGAGVFYLFEPTYRFISRERSA
jgi:hypothetical protein